MGRDGCDDIPRVGVPLEPQPEGLFPGKAQCGAHGLVLHTTPSLPPSPVFSVAGKAGKGKELIGEYLPSS